MGVLRVPENVSSITISGNILVPADNLVTVADAADMTILTNWISKPSLIVAAANGDTDIRLPSNVSSVTINGNVYAAVDGVISAVPAADATAFLYQNFILVTG